LVVDRPVDEDVDSELMPDDAEVEREETLLFVVDRPVESEVTPLALELMPLEAEVESEPTLLFVVDRPDDAEVDSEPM
jgi:hypothetical protein